MRLVRNRTVASTVLQRHPPSVPEDRDPAVLVDVVVLSGDMVLFDAIKSAIGERNPVWRARSAEESVDLLLTGRCGVLLLDMSAVSTQPATLVQQISDQFPDVVIVAAGRREDESVLAALISEGLVFRFMHKPITAKRAGMFLQAATRCHVERREAQAVRPLLPIPQVLPKRFDLGKWLFVATGVAAFAGVLWLVAGDHRPASEETPAPAVAATPAPVDAARRSDPVLARARAAFAAGRFEAPTGRNALDLYAAVLLADPDQAEARAGLDKTIARLVGDAEKAVAAGNRAEAERLLQRIRTAEPDNDAAAHLDDLLHPVPSVPMPPPPAQRTPPSTSTTPVALAASAPVPSATVHAPVSTLPTTPPVTAGARTAPNPAVAQSASRPATRAVVTPDPLAPRYSNAEELKRAQRYSVAHPNGQRIYARPAAARLPIAGYVNGNASEPSTTSPAPASPQPESTPSQDQASNAASVTGEVASLTLPADEGDRVFAANPVYPAGALQNRIEGWVEVSFTITETGSVRDVEVVDAQPRGVFEHAATRAVGDWRFRPRYANGQPVPRRSMVTLRFNLDG